jgi:hypothetical protein
LHLWFKQPHCLFHHGCRLDRWVFLFFFGLLPQSHSIPLDGKWYCHVIFF